MKLNRANYMLSATHQAIFCLSMNGKLVAQIFLVCGG